jgi:hypothetical protein
MLKKSHFIPARRRWSRLKPLVHAGLVLGTMWGVLAIFDLFRKYDLDKGVERSYLALGLWALCVSALAVAPRLRLGLSSRGGLAWLLAGLAVVALIDDGVASFRAVITTATADEIAMDQGQNSYRAVEFLRLGANPYSRNAMLDPVSYCALEQQLRGYRHNCLDRPLSPYAVSLMTRYWVKPDPSAASEFMPVVGDLEECRDLAFAASSLGYKYGPVQLALYYPFVVVFGKSGIFVSHQFLLISASLVLFMLAFRRGKGSVLAAAAALVMFLVPSHLKHNIFYLSSSDLGPTLLAMLAMLCFEHRRDAWGALFVGASIATKLLPGVIFLPLLLGIRKHHWPLVLIPIVLSYGPFLVWDATGFINNIVLFNFARPTDSTALAHFVGKTQLLWVETGALVTIAMALFFCFRKGWSLRSRLIYLWTGHIAVLICGTIFHNNYLVWLLPLFGLTAAELLSPVDVSSGT